MPGCYGHYSDNQQVQSRAPGLKEDEKTKWKHWQQLSRSRSAWLDFGEAEAGVPRKGPGKAPP